MWARLLWCPTGTIARWRFKILHMFFHDILMKLSHPLFHWPILWISFILFYFFNSVFLPPFPFQRADWQRQAEKFGTTHSNSPDEIATAATTVASILNFTRRGWLLTFKSTSLLCSWRGLSFVIRFDGPLSAECPLKFNLGPVISKAGILQSKRRTLLLQNLANCGVSGQNEIEEPDEDMVRLKFDTIDPHHTSSRTIAFFYGDLRPLLTLRQHSFSDKAVHLRTCRISGRS